MKIDFTQMSDEQVMELYQKTNDDCYFNALYVRYISRLTNYAHKFLQGPDLEDTVSEAFVCLIRFKDTYIPGSKFSPWAYTIVKNKCLEVLRKKRNFQQIEETSWLTESSFDLIKTMCIQEIITEILSIVDMHLSDQQKEIFKLRFLKEMDNPEIMEITGLTDIAVRRSLNEGRKS
ncbi:MAG: sigma-70 family RNA polymerase sigma factor [Saprospiraceae bacterium]|nr:sigma-70 family RNA polymerase sigma factor [Saprospiraceae bacterium]